MYMHMYVMYMYVCIPLFMLNEFHVACQMSLGLQTLSFYLYIVQNERCFVCCTYLVYYVQMYIYVKQYRTNIQNKESKEKFIKLPVTAALGGYIIEWSHSTISISL